MSTSSHVHSHAQVQGNSLVHIVTMSQIISQHKTTVDICGEIEAQGHGAELVVTHAPSHVSPLVAVL